MNISIVIPTFNRAQFLACAINSALEQSLPPFEIVVVDDGSTDDTQQIVSQFGQRVVSIRQNNAGKACALNAGFKAVRGDVAIVLDDDDIFPTNAIELHASALENAPNADFSYGRFVRFAGAFDASARYNDCEYVPASDPRRLAVKLMESSFLPNPTWAVRMSAARAAGPYLTDMRYSEDYDMILRLARRNNGVFVDAPVLYQRKHQGFRGPAQERIFTRDAVAKWITYDRKIFERLDDEWSLADFRPFNASLDEQGDAIAWLQRGVVLFLRKAYPRAFRAFDEYRRLLGDRAPTDRERAIAKSLLSCRYGIDDILNTSESDVAERLANYRWSLPLKRAFSSHLRWRLRKAVFDGQWQEASDLTKFGLRAFGPMAWTQSTIGIS
jgi:glycosyltransferase involved in cell wall biosynthesis